MFSKEDRQKEWDKIFNQSKQYFSNESQELSSEQIQDLAKIMAIGFSLILSNRKDRLEEKQEQEQEEKQEQQEEKEEDDDPQQSQAEENTKQEKKEEVDILEEQNNSTQKISREEYFQQVNNKLEEEKQQADEDYQLFLQAHQAQQGKTPTQIQGTEEYYKEIAKNAEDITNQQISSQKGEGEFIQEQYHKVKDTQGKTTLKDTISPNPHPTDKTDLVAIEKRVYDILVAVLVLVTFALIVSVGSILILFNMKEKVPYVVTFNEPTKTFVSIDKINDDFLAKEELIRSLVGAYVEARESIDGVTDKRNRELVRHQSSDKIWRTYENIISQKNSVYLQAKEDGDGTDGLVRKVEVVNITLENPKTAFVETIEKLYFGGYLKEEKRYRIILKYKFIKQTILYDSVPKNPLGFQVTTYSKTTLAVIKERPKENLTNQTDLKNSVIKEFSDIKEARKDAEKSNSYSPTKEELAEQSKSSSKENETPTTKEKWK